MSRLREKRKARGITQESLAETLCLNPQMIGHYENGFRSIDGAKIETLAAIAKALDCKIWEILESDDLREKVKIVC